MGGKEAPRQFMFPLKPVLSHLAAITLSSTFVSAKEPEIRLDPDTDWGVRPTNVEAVLNNAAGELMRSFPDEKLDPIRVERKTKAAPIVLFARTSQGEYRVQLSASGAHWAQYAFQFAHELCHILCRYDRDEQANRWFEESICELASLFTLRRMADSWRTEPPYRNWKNYSGALENYAQDRIDNAAEAQPSSFASWFEAERESLESDAHQRLKNTVVAASLLELFESQPEHWAAVHSLNVSKGTEQQTFEMYIAAWRKNVPERHRLFIETIAKHFGVSLPPH
jgi:hypothetical protein